VAPSLTVGLAYMLVDGVAGQARSPGNKTDISTCLFPAPLDYCSGDPPAPRSHQSPVIRRRAVWDVPSRICSFGACCEHPA